MRTTDYSWVLDGWRLHDDSIIKTGYNLAVHTGLPYVVFQVVTTTGAVSVRCDPCSHDQDRIAYAVMVRNDLEKALAKQGKSPVPESDAPTRLARHLRESDLGVCRGDGGQLTLYFHDEATAKQVLWLIYEVKGSETFQRSPAEDPHAACLAAE